MALRLPEAFAQDMRVFSDQERVTRERLIPKMEAIVARLGEHRAAVDAEFAEKKARAQATVSAMGEQSLASYPVGFCRQIRDQVWARATADGEFQRLIGRDVVVRPVFILLEGRFFQNAVQLGNLYVDVANDTVSVDEPRCEWMPISRVPYENVESWPQFAGVARRYLNVELYPNLLFPLAFPYAPYFAIRPGGRVDLLAVQPILLLKDLGDRMRRARALLTDPEFGARRLPDEYEQLIRRACGGNLAEAFPLEFSPSTPEEIRRGVVADFEMLATEKEENARPVVEKYLTLMTEATKRLAAMNLLPTAEEIRALRAAGEIPDEQTTLES